MGVVGGLRAPPTEVAHLDVDRAVTAVGEPAGELAGFAGAGVSVLNGVRGGFPEGELQVLAEPD